MPEQPNFLPPEFPDDSAIQLGQAFSTWLSTHQQPPAGSPPLMKEVYIDKLSLMNVLKDGPGQKCAGAVFYLTYVDVLDPKDGLVKTQATLAAVGVDTSGRLINAQPDSFYISKPCPPYCPSWS